MIKANEWIFDVLFINFEFSHGNYEKAAIIQKSHLSVIEWILRFQAGFWWQISACP